MCRYGVRYPADDDVEDMLFEDLASYLVPIAAADGTATAANA